MESGQIFFSLNVSKNYFSQVHGHKFGQKCHYWGQFGQNRSFLVKMVKLGSFLGQNGASGQNLGKVVKKISLNVSKNYFIRVYGHKFGQKYY